MQLHLLYHADDNICLPCCARGDQGSSRLPRNILSTPIVAYSDWAVQEMSSYIARLVAHMLCTESGVKYTVKTTKGYICHPMRFMILFKLVNTGHSLLFVRGFSSSDPFNRTPSLKLGMPSVISDDEVRVPTHPAKQLYSLRDRGIILGKKFYGVFVNTQKFRYTLVPTEENVRVTLERHGAGRTSQRISLRWLASPQ